MIETFRKSFIKKRGVKEMQRSKELRKGDTLIFFKEGKKVMISTFDYTLKLLMEDLSGEVEKVLYEIDITIRGRENGTKTDANFYTNEETVKELMEVIKKNMPNIF